jgi:hypothetical protein
MALQALGKKRLKALSPSALRVLAGFPVASV